MLPFGKLAVTTAILVFLAVPGSAQTYRFEDDERGNIEGKRASCEVYARIAIVQADANRDYRCGYTGERWTRDGLTHFRFCRRASRLLIAEHLRDRARELQRCFDDLGDFDEDR
jgi:hypothetical protein